MTPLDVARGFLDRGRNSVPVRHRENKPIAKEWQVVRPETVAEHFGPEPMNVGIRRGRNSGGLVDIDRDAPESLAVTSRFDAGNGLHLRPRLEQGVTSTLCVDLMRANRQSRVSIRRPDAVRRSPSACEGRARRSPQPKLSPPRQSPSAKSPSHAEGAERPCDPGLGAMMSIIAPRTADPDNPLITRIQHPKSTPTTRSRADEFEDGHHPRNVLENCRGRQ
jgi:hypothetical protein